MTAQSRRGGGTSFPQLGHGEHKKMYGDVVVLQCRVGSHGACMGSARAQREARGAIFKDVLESVARNVAPNGTDFRGARSLSEHAAHARPASWPLALTASRNVRIVFSMSRNVRMNECWMKTIGQMLSRQT